MPPCKQQNLQERGIAVKNKNLIDALIRSWALTHGGRLSISGLVLLVLGVTPRVVNRRSESQLCR
ncbi:MAG: hypothetical protein A07HR60_01141 [uncultured archaeon A07HR60]|nr:MAG: hypothetical protein A07HR60_01141 [uncultured archaeon A07HR60]